MLNGFSLVPMIKYQIRLQALSIVFSVDFEQVFAERRYGIYILKNKQSVARSYPVKKVSLFNEVAELRPELFIKRNTGTGVFP